MSIRSTLFLFCSLTGLLAAQPNLDWQKSLGGTKSDGAYDIQLTPDSGFILAALSSSNDHDVSGNHGDLDAWIVKLNNAGIIQWQKSFGGSSHDDAVAILNTSDGGYVFAGSTNSNNGDVSGNHGAADFWVVKLTENGGIEWQKTLGGSSDEQVYSIQQTNDEGYILVGITDSNDGQVSGSHGSKDVWVVKLNSSGEIQWQKSLGGSSPDYAYEIQQTVDGGYILAGSTWSLDGDVSENNGFIDAWVVKLDNLGAIQWEKAYGGSFIDNARSIEQTSDGGYIMAGESSSIDGDLSSNHGLSDYWVVKLSGTGEILWQSVLGGSDYDYLSNFAQTNDGGCVLVGRSSSTDGDVSENHGSSDIWVVKINNMGVLQWQKSVGGVNFEVGECIKQTSDGGILFAGESDSNDGDATNNYGAADVWLVKLSPESVGIQEMPVHSSAPSLEIYPNPATQLVTVNNVSDEPTMALQVMNLLGQPLLQKTILNHGNLDISTLPNGIYSIQATTPSGIVFSNKLIKQE